MQPAVEAPNLVQDCFMGRWYHIVVLRHGGQESEPAYLRPAVA
jgi:hypothetical protein